MRELILLVSLVVCCYAAPTSLQQSSSEHTTHSVLLNRPSPINPDIPSDPKPEEKITMITDPKEIVKHKREAVDDPYDHISRFAPTIPPAKQVEKVQAQESHEKGIKGSDSIEHRQKREEMFHIIEAKKPAIAPSAVPTPTSLKKEAKEDSEKQAHHHNEPETPTLHVPKTRQLRQVDPHLIGASTVGFAPQIHIDDEEKNTPDEEVITETSPQEQNVSEAQQEEISDKHEDGQAKRDIPVPLVPKYHHPEESPKNDEKVEEANAGHKNSESDESDEDSKEKKHAAPIQTHQLVQNSVHAQGANGYQQQISTQPLLLDGSNKEDAGHDKPLVEAGHQQIHQLFTPAVHPQPASNNLPHISTQHLTVDGQNSDYLVHGNPIVQPEVKHETAVASHETSVTESDSKPLEDHLADIKQTKIIAYEPPANDDHLAIKHPVPVAELFSRPKA